MIRLFNVYFPSRTLVLAFSELMLSVAALIAATFVWFGRDTDLALQYDYGPLRLLFAATACVLCMYYYDLYESQVVGNIREITVRLAQVLGTVCVVLSVVYYGFPTIQLERGPFLIWIALVGPWLYLWRRMFLGLTRSLHMPERTLLMGTGPLADALVAEVEDRPEYGLLFVGYVERDEAAQIKNLPHLGGIADLAEVVRREGIRRIIVSMGERRGRLPVKDLLPLKASGVTIQDAADIYEALTGKVPLNSARLTSWLLFSPGFRVSPWVLFLKRTVSIVVASVALLITLPLMLAIAIAIRLESRGPILFRQARVGKDRKLFILYKFRSMVDDADRETPVQANDKRITRVGRWLRRTRLDELPQLYNILRGDMYFVGPRPCIPKEEEESVREIPLYDQRWSVKPGATGWAQVKGGYCATLEDRTDRLGYDLFYIKNVSIGLDFLIIFETLKILLLGRGAR
ncbi:MAG: sugar transferase [Bryobacteraceae bacterium]